VDGHWQCFDITGVSSILSMQTMVR